MRIGSDGGGLSAGLAANIGESDTSGGVGTAIAILMMKKATELDGKQAIALIAAATGVGTRLDVRA